MTHDILVFLGRVSRDVCKPRDRDDEVERLLDRIRQLEAALAGPEVTLPGEWRLRRREAQVFSLLLKRERVTKDLLSAAFNIDEQRSPEVWEAHVSNLRKRLRPFGVVIEARRHEGYRLVDRRRWREQLQVLA